MLKLPAHTRYAYSPIVERKGYGWPGGKRLAFYVALNIEHFAFGAGLGMDPVRSGQQTTRNFAWRDYGNRIGNWHLFEILDELKLSATILLNSSVCYHYPEIVEKIKARGDDVIGHVEAAKKLGIDAVQYTTTDALEQELLKRGVRCNF